jgi:hypothetical protein
LWKRSESLEFRASPHRRIAASPHRLPARPHCHGTSQSVTLLKIALADAEMAVFHTTTGFDIPVIVQRRGGRRVDDDSLKKFWQETGEVAEQHGCYVFSMRAGRGEKPWYVGKASRLSFATECFGAHKLNIYNGILGNMKGRPRLTFVIPARARGGVANGGN